jgi:hypothetical protein
MHIVLGLAVAVAMVVPVLAMVKTVKFGLIIHSKGKYNHLLRPAHILGVVYPLELKGIIHDILRVIPMPYLIDTGSWESGDIVDGKFKESCWGKTTQWVSIGGGWSWEIATLARLYDIDQNTEEQTGCTFGLRYKVLGLFEV